MTERHPPLRDPHLAEVANWHPIEGTPMKKRVAAGSSIGAMIETYDFIGFGIAAALYFNTVFFPANDPLSGTLLSFATLGIGFAVRPLGGIIGGIRTSGWSGNNRVIAKNPARLAAAAQYNGLQFTASRPSH